MEVIQPKHKVLKAIRASWTKASSYLPNEWSKDNPSRGQCAVSTLVIQDYLGGSILRYNAVFNGKVEKHYVNQLEGGELIDSAKEQFPASVVMQVNPVDIKGYKSVRDKMLANVGTKRRYEVLNRRVIKNLRLID